MTSLRLKCRVAIATAAVLGSVLAITTVAAPAAADSSVLTAAQPSALLSIDQNRTTVVDRIVSDWGAALATSGAGLTSDQLRTLLNGLRADHLLAASLAGSLNGLRDVLANAVTSAAAIKSPRLQTKALGDASQDLVYTPVNPCRLFDTRPAQGGIGVMTPNVRRTYGATAPVANQGGPGGCNATFGAAVALIQIGSLTPSGNGYLQAGPQGVASFPNALILYQPGDQYGTAVTMPLNPTNGRFDLQVQFASTDLYGDLLGYFMPPVQPGNGLRIYQASNSAGTSPDTVNGHAENLIASCLDNSLGCLLAPVPIGGTIAGGGSHPGFYLGPNVVLDDFGTVGGGTYNRVGTDDQDPRSASFATVGGGFGNTASAETATVAGGTTNSASGIDATVAGGDHNIASGVASTVAGGAGNNAGGTFSFAAGNNAKANENGMFVWSDSQFYDFDPTTFRSAGQSVNTFNVRATGVGGVYFVTGIDGSTGAPTWGCSAHNGSGWTCTSDRNVKRNLLRLDGKAVLSKLATLPIYQWQPKDGPNAELTHFGPMAQDFYAAFGLGDSDKTIGLQDAEGVALAAIQGLHQLLQEKDREIAQLKATVKKLDVLDRKLGLIEASLRLK